MNLRVGIAVSAACIMAAAVLGLGIARERTPLPQMLVYKSPTCGCCVKWVEHMAAAGFEVDVRDRTDMSVIKASFGIARPLTSCHTALVNDYVIEGHVPAAYVLRFLEEAPEARGLAVPGMPIGSPGMEGPGAKPYDVLTFNADGDSQVYARVTP